MRKDLLIKVLLWGALFIPLCTFATDWYIMTVDTTPNSGVYGTSIALDSLGRPHIAYCRYNGPGLMYASWNPQDSTWIIESVFDSAGIKKEVDGAKFAGGQTSLAFDSRGYPRISFWWGDLGYAWKDSLGWHTTHPNPGPWIDGTSLVLDRNDYAHIGYSVEINDEMALVLHTYQDEYSWQTEVADTIFWSFFHNISLAVDKNDCIHAIYGFPRPEAPGSYLAGRGIMYGKRDEGGVWHTEKIIDSSDVLVECEGYPSIVLDSLERPCIAYSSWDTVDTKKTRVGKVKYATKRDENWHIERVDTNDASTHTGFLALDSFGNPHIAYGDVSGWLKYAWKSNGIWHIEKIDSIYGTAAQASYKGLVIGEDGYVHISYNKEYTMNWGNLRYATGRPEVGIETEPNRFHGELLRIYPSVAISQREVQIEYFLEKTANVNVSIYNIAGQKVTELVSEKKLSGRYKDYWRTESTGSGVYFCCLRVDGKFSAVKRVVILN